MQAAVVEVDVETFAVRLLKSSSSTTRDAPSTR